MTDANAHDVVVLGGGLAGLTLALQLKQRLPDLDVLVLERRVHPVPQAAHKVGESSVEIAANYFGQVLGLDAHLQKTQLKKFGFRFFFSEGAERIDDVTELGASTFLTTPSYQLDRGIFENDLGAMVRARGVRFIDGATVRDVEIGTRDIAHRVHYDDAAGTHAIAARWLIDATGRAGLLKRRLDLAEPNQHDANAVWFRIGARIDVDEWSDDLDVAGFRQRMAETFDQLDALARQIVGRATAEHPSLDGSGVLDLIAPDAGRDATPLLFAEAA